MPILDQYGNPITSRSFLKSSENGGGRLPSIPARPLDPLKKLITQRDWQVVSYISDRVFANFPIVEGIISQKSMFAIGNAWQPVFQGDATDWGKEARRWLVEEWFPTCDVRGMNYDFVTNLYQGSVSIDAAGDLIELLTVSENGWPMIQMIPCRQIGQWTTGGADEKVSGGPYDGATIRNGVIMNRAGRPIAYRKLGDDRGSWEDIPAANIIHTFEPKWIDQVRGFPLFSSCLEDIGMSSQSEEWEQQAMLIASAIGLIDTNETGEPETLPNNPFGIQDPTKPTENTPAGVHIQTMMGGMIRYMKANAGRKLEQLITQKPGEDWENYQDRIARKIAVAANWSYGYAWKPESITTPGQRGELVKCRGAVSDRQSLLMPRYRRKIGYAISVAIKNGFLPPYPGKDKGGFLKWTATMPPRISIDEGRDRSQRREDFKMGLLNMTTIVEEDGNKTLEDHLRQRAHEIALRRKIQREVEQETNEKIEDREMIMLTPNEQATQQNQGADTQQSNEK